MVLEGLLENRFQMTHPPLKTKMLANMHPPLLGYSVHLIDAVPFFLFLFKWPCYKGNYPTEPWRWLEQNKMIFRLLKCTQRSHLWSRKEIFPPEGLACAIMEVGERSEHTEAQRASRTREPRKAGRKEVELRLRVDKQRYAGAWEVLLSFQRRIGPFDTEKKFRTRQHGKAEVEMLLRYRDIVI